jgi:hypothetical protein
MALKYLNKQKKYEDEKRLQIKNTYTKYYKCEEIIINSE